MNTLVENHSAPPISGMLDSESLASASTSSLTSSQNYTPPAARLVSNVGASTSASDGAASQQARPSHMTPEIEIIDVDSLDDDEVFFINSATGADAYSAAGSASSSHSAATGPQPQTATTSTLGRRRRRASTPSDIICVLDSDEEDEGSIDFGVTSTLDDEDEGIAAVIARNRRRRSAASGTSMGSATGSSRIHHGSFRGRLISPPPPRPYRTDIPPLPSIGHLPRIMPHFRNGNYPGSLPSFPFEASGPSRPPGLSDTTTTGGPIRPNGEPFAFEANLHGRPPPRALGNEVETRTIPLPSAGSSSSSNRRDRRGVSAAPHSQHVPAMGFGGAFLNNTRGVAPGRERGDGFFSRANDTLTALYHNGLPPSFRLFGLETLFWFGPTEDNDPSLNDGAQTPTTPSWRRKEEEHYRSRYTHEDPPESGFTFDFAPASSPSPKGKKKAEPEIIVIDDDDDDDEVEVVYGNKQEEGSSLEAVEGIDSGGAGPSKLRTVSTGGRSARPTSPKLTNVLVCALCSDGLVLNASASGDPVEESARRIWSLRCGHLVDGKCARRLGIPVEIPFVDGENAGGAVVNGKGKGRAKGKGKAKAATVLVGMDHPSAASASAFTIASASGSHSSMMTTGATAAAAAAEKTLPKRAKRRRMKPKVEAEWKWKCPVESCEVGHLSIKLGGVWEHDRAKGAIQVFV